MNHFHNLIYSSRTLIIILVRKKPHEAVLRTMDVYQLYYLYYPFTM